MPTIEERLQILEQEHTELKKTIELQTIAIHALVSKEAFEKLQETAEKSQEQNNKLFDVLDNHNTFTNERLGDIQNQLIELDGKIVGQQTETRQHFARIETAQAEHTTVLEQHTTILEQHTTILEQHTTLLTEILARLPKPQP